MSSNRSTRRKFLQQTGGALAGATLASAISQRAYAGEDNTIKIALVGCGGRGNGAVREALQTAGPTNSWPSPTSSRNASGVASPG